MARPPVDCWVQQPGWFCNAERRLFYALWRARCVGPPALQSKSRVTLFAADVDIGHAGARIHFVGERGVCRLPFCKVGWLLVLLSMLPGVVIVAWIPLGDADHACGPELAVCVGRYWLLNKFKG